MTRRLIAPNRGEPIGRVQASRNSGEPRIFASARLQSFLEEIERLLNSNTDMGDEALLAGGAANSKADQALALLGLIAEAADMAAFAPVPSSGQQEGDLAPAESRVPVGDFNGPVLPVGASGSFTTADIPPKTVTVTNGIVTRIR